jgi:hypothetical protein
MHDDVAARERRGERIAIGELLAVDAIECDRARSER